MINVKRPGSVRINIFKLIPLPPFCFVLYTSLIHSGKFFCLHQVTKWFCSLNVFLRKVILWISNVCQPFSFLTQFLWTAFCLLFPHLSVKHIYFFALATPYANKYIWMYYLQHFQSFSYDKSIYSKFQIQFNLLDNIK